jgi:cytochrome c553
VQEDWYLMEQLRKYQTGMRGYDVRDIEGGLMQSIVRLYSLQDLKDIVAFITRGAPPKNTE